MMVFVGGDDPRHDSTTMPPPPPPERPRSLHNFSLPCLKWGSQKQLRCVRTGNDSVYGGPRRNSPPEDGIEAVRKRLMLDLQSEMNKMKFAVLRKGGGSGIGSGSGEEIALSKAAAVDAAEARPWNLRTRRAACKEPNNGGGGGGAARNQRTEEQDCGFLSPARGAVTSPPNRNDFIGGSKRTREKLSLIVPLSRNEIVEDFIAITGMRPPRRPKKRPRNVQKQLDTLFPGLWLTEITPETYKVNGDQEVGKR